MHSFIHLFIYSFTLFSFLTTVTKLPPITCFHKIKDFDPVLVKYSPTVYDDGPTVNQHGDWMMAPLTACLPYTCTFTRRHASKNIFDLIFRLSRERRVACTLDARVLCMMTYWIIISRHSPDTVSLLAHRLRRWPNIETAMDECSVFAVIKLIFIVLKKRVKKRWRDVHAFCLWDPSKYRSVNLNFSYQKCSIL